MNLTNLFHTIAATAATTLLLQAGTAEFNLHAQTSGTLDPWVTVDQFKGDFDGASGTAIAADPFGNILAVASAGFYGQPSHFIIRKSTDSGASFFTFADMISPGASSLACDSAGDLYANSGSVGLLKSIDGGLNWSVIAPSPAALVVAPDGTVFIANSDGSTGLWITQRSSDGGGTWVTIDNYRPRKGNAAPHAIALDLQGNVYVAGNEDTGQGAHILVRRSSPGGAFSTVDSWQPSKGIAAALAIATDSSGQVYVGGYATDGTPNQRRDHFLVRKSTNGTGNYWTVDDIVTSTGPSRATSIAVDSMNGVYVAGWLSGSNWIIRKALDGLHFSGSDNVAGGAIRGLTTLGLNVFACGQLPVAGRNTLTVRRLAP